MVGLAPVPLEQRPLRSRRGIPLPRTVQIVFSLRVMGLRPGHLATAKGRCAVAVSAPSNQQHDPQLTQVATVREPAGTESERHAAWAGRLESIDAFLLLLAKAVRQVHAYPLTSQVCVEAIQACRSHLVAMDGFDHVALVITPETLVAHNRPVGDVVFVGQELVRRLRRARVADLTIHREATARDLTRFCTHLVRCSEGAATSPNLAAALAEDGIDAINVTIASRREVLDVGAAAPAQRDLVSHERRRREESEAAHVHAVQLFPPHRGWIRLDPAEAYDELTLADLAILVDQPQHLARMLQRLVDDASPGSDVDDLAAFERRFSDVASLFAGLEPRLSRVMFGKLASAVLALDVEPRHALLKRSILPAIFDGRPDAMVLPAFPDADLAESLCLLLELETAAPAILASALDQLKLDPERRTVLVPMMEELIRVQREVAAGGLDARTALAMDQHARRLTKIDATERRSFVELAGFDFRLDDDATRAIDGVKGGIHDVDSVMAELFCLANLVGLQPNPEVAAPFMRSAMVHAATLVTANRWDDLAVALERFAEVTARLSERRPEITALINTELAAFATVEVAAALLTRRERAVANEDVALRIIDALGPAIAPSLLTILTAEDADSGAAAALMCERAPLFAPQLADIAATASRGTRPHIARVLGHAGAGYEDFLGAMLDEKDERTAREALRGLSRIGSARAAALVSRAARDARAWLNTATIETLLRYPPEFLAPAMLDLLGHRPFVLAHPEAASRLLGRAGQARDRTLLPVLEGLRSFRFRFWNRALVRVAHEAAAILARS